MAARSMAPASAGAAVGVLAAHEARCLVPAVGNVDEEAGEGLWPPLRWSTPFATGHRCSLIVRGRRSRRVSSASVVRIVPPTGASLPFDLDCCFKTGPEVWGQ